MRRTLWLIIILILVSIFIDLPKIPTNLTIPQQRFDLPSNWPLKQIVIIPQDIRLSDLTDVFLLKLGLDLQGGTQMILETDMSKIPDDQKDSALESATQVIERRVNLFGVSESIVQASKIGNQRRILVDLPGIKDASAAVQLIGKTAQLEFRELPATLSAEATQSAFLAYMEATSSGLTGADLKRSQVVFGQTQDSGPGVQIEFTSEGSKKFAEITKRNVGKPLLIFLDDQIVSDPLVNEPILAGTSVISGGFSTEMAKELAIQLNAGALPVPIKIIEQRSIGPSLGQESINKSIIAGIIGLLTVMIYMAIYYGWLGLVADLALVIYTLFVLAIFKTGFFIMPPITLTLAGIAGFILSIGMAVDANILIFERMKEEKRWGKSGRVVLDLGFQRAWSSIRDSNISTLMTAAILYFLGTGMVKGFAVTLAIGVLVSMFTAITVTKTILRLIIK